MAFATSNVRKTRVGNRFMTTGGWTGAEGDAEGTIGVEGGNIYLAEFLVQDTDSPVEKPGISTSTSGAVTTVTVYNHQAVTKGGFIIIHA